MRIKNLWISESGCIISSSHSSFSDAVGLQYGPGYRTLIEAWGGASDALARLRARSTHEGTQVHPADLDGEVRLDRVEVDARDGQHALRRAVRGLALPSAHSALYTRGRPGSVVLQRKRAPLVRPP